MLFIRQHFTKLLQHVIPGLTKNPIKQESPSAMHYSTRFPIKLGMTKGRPASQSQDGFTLIEMLVTMVVISILSLTVANFIADWLQNSSLAQKRASLLSNAEQALDTINTDIRLSGDADQTNRWADPNAPGGKYSWHSTSDTLVLAKAAIDKHGHIIFSDPSHYISKKDNEIYYLDGHTLYRRTLASKDTSDRATTTCPSASSSSDCPPDKTVATDVRNFAVTYYDADNHTVQPADARSIQLNITLAEQLNDKTIKASYKTRMVFRNE
jgi:prepilin-type N-terminal cleavage/methylation domain-containing protein